MIKLLIPYNRGGKNIPAGTEINLPAEEEKLLIAGGSAEAVYVENTPKEIEQSSEQLVKALDEKYNKDPLIKAALKAEVVFDEKATKAQIIAAIIEHGKAEELLKEGE